MTHWLYKMAIDLYQPFTNPITKETFRCISFNEDAFTMEWIVQPGGYVPFEHVHINQDEIFHVQQGEIRVKINGHIPLGEAGQTAFIPPGLKHIAYTNRPEKLACMFDNKPALDPYKTIDSLPALTFVASM